MNIRSTIALLGVALCLDVARPACANDHIFPSAPAAKAAMDYDSKGFVINGKRVFVASAGMEYARVPRALWRDRLLRLKRAGFNCVEVYCFWNWHEPQEGKFDFAGDHDLDAYLKLAKQMGLYAICRVGPYYCAEWDFGGYPLWLKFKPGIRVREDNPEFEAAVDHFFDKLIPVVAANQINNGGSVILVQLENEHNAGWGTDLPNAYFKHLQAKALSLGLQVPYFFSGLHHGSDPAGDGMLDSADRPNPWFSTEFWSVWYSQYGPKPGDDTTYARRTWKIIAHGGGGYNDYMAHGGTNFAYTNNNEDAASYDYGAAVGQAGDLRPIYFAYKRANLFARSFQDILGTAVDATDDFNGAATASDLRVTARKSPAGTIVFLDNPGKSPVSTQMTLDGKPYPAVGSLTLAPGEILPIVRDFTLAPGVELQWAAVRLLGLAAQGNTTTLVAYGPPGSPAALRFAVPVGTKVEQGGAAWTADNATTLTLTPAFDAKRPAEYSFTAGPRRIRILAVSEALADRTWFVDAGTQTYVVCGPAFAGDAILQNGRLRLTVERPWQEVLSSDIVAYGADAAPIRLSKISAAASRVDALGEAEWQTRSGREAAARTYDDHAWLTSDAPLQMGADGDLTADAWYRTKIQAPAAGQYTLQFAGARDRMTAFLDGAHLPPTAVHGANIELNLTPGPHTLAVFTAHDGRDKLFGRVGPIDTVDAKGLTGPAFLRRPAPGGGLVTGWRVLPLGGGITAAAPPAADAPGWTDYTLGADAFNHQRGRAWFEATLANAPNAAAGAALHFPSVDDNATIFINGKQAARHEGYQEAFDVPLDNLKTDGTPNTIAVLVDNNDGTGGIAPDVTLQRLLSSTPVTGWKMRGGPGAPNAKTGWAGIAANAVFPGPQFYRTTFQAAPPAAEGAHPIWRVITTGLGHGSVWVNGHNLGRYPEKIPINGLYIPECWLQTGTNALVIYDENGKRPEGVAIAAEAAASRDVEVWTAR